MTLGTSLIGRQKRLSMAIIASAFVLASCGGSHEGGAAGPGGMQGQQQRAVSVTVLNAQSTTVESVRELSGRVHAYAEAEIRPQVSGLIQKRLFVEGQDVEEGEALYQIESSEYRAAVDSAAADLAGAEANAASARETANRFKRLAEINAVSKQEYDEAVAAAKRAEANIGIAKAALESARINLRRTTVRSPISGRIGRSNVTPGALVTANQSTALARVLNIDPVYVDMTAASSELLKWRRQVERGEILTTGDNESVPVTVQLENGETFNETGSLEFSEINVDEAAGTVILRAVVPNTDGLLLPGMFVKASFSAGALENIYLVPQRAVQRTQRGEPFVYVVGEGDMATQKILSVNGTQDGQWIVTSGPEDGDRIISSGFQNIQGPTQVAVVEGQPNMAATSAPANAATE